VTSRFYNFREKRVEFPSQQESDVLEMTKRRIFWLGDSGPVEVAHPYDCQYANLSREKMIALAGRLAAQGLIKLDGDKATSTDALRQEEPAIRAAMQKGVEAGLAATKVSA
jgi:CRP-like cAMP-binding protein